MTLSPFSRIIRIVEFLERRAPTERGAECVRYTHLCSEGCASSSNILSASDIAALGRWNDITEYKDGALKTLDKSPSRWMRVLECLHVEALYEDSWSTCDNCRRLIETEASSHFFRPYYIEYQGSRICFDCVRKDIGLLEDYARTFEGKADIEPPDELDFSLVGYVKLSVDPDEYLLGGIHSGVVKLKTLLKNCSLKRFLFSANRSGSFSSTLNIWIHKESRRDFQPTENVSYHQKPVYDMVEDLINKLPDDEDDDES